jgi:hypothetical protein
MPNAKQHTLREGSRVQGAVTGREGRISNPTFSPTGKPEWTVDFEPGTGDGSPGPSPVAEENLVLVDGPPETGTSALVRAAHACVDSGALPQASVDRILRIVQDDGLNVGVGDYVREPATGEVYQVAAINNGAHRLRGGARSSWRNSAIIRERFERVNVTPVEGHKHA